MDELRERIEIWQISSPPEQLFLCHWFLEYYKDFVLYPQHQIGRYRTDFMLRPWDHFDSLIIKVPLPILRELYGRLPLYAIEIDGFKWHDKTRQQAEDDRKRERIIQEHGYTVVRFAAREVLRDPESCTKVMHDRARKDVQRIYNQFFSK